MRYFKVYLLNRSGRIKDTKLVKAPSDAQALVIAHSEFEGCDFEVWDRTRLIGQSAEDPNPGDVIASRAMTECTGPVVHV